jgi:hypothetical protein
MNTSSPCSVCADPNHQKIQRAAPEHIARCFESGAYAGARLMELVGLDKVSLVED